ncbi:MAG: cytochrome c [Proteobacteria bacterium]|nr:cytochrome c [Pseudomonadota bacterium]
MKYITISIFLFCMNSNVFASQDEIQQVMPNSQKNCEPGTENCRQKRLQSSGEQIPITDDMRQFVKLPEMTKKILRQRMLSNLMALTQILGLLADDKLESAANIAETKIGDWRIGGGTGMGPGKFMPKEMRQIGMSMHKTVDEFAKIARTGDKAKTYAALGNVTAVCVACHSSYRTR